MLSALLHQVLMVWLTLKKPAYREGGTVNSGNESLNTLTLKNNGYTKKRFMILGRFSLYKTELCKKELFRPMP